MHQRVLQTTLTLVLLLMGCGRNTTESVSAPGEEPVGTSGSERVMVYAVNYPLAYFAERLGGDAVEVILPVPAGIDPAHWNPDPDAVAGYQQADLILVNGAGYARWLERVSLPTARIVDTGATVAARWLPLEEGPVHSHGPAGEHSHKGYAATIWLDPELAMAQAESIAQALIGRARQHAVEIETARTALLADWQELDASLEASAVNIGDRPVLFSHPVYQYLQARYDLNGRSLHWEPGEVPDEAQWRELESVLEQHPARWMIWEGAPLPEVKQRLAAIGIESTIFAPCGNRPETGDLLTVMVRNATELARIAVAE